VILTADLCMLYAAAIFVFILEKMLPDVVNKSASSFPSQYRSQIPTWLLWAGLRTLYSMANDWRSEPHPSAWECVITQQLGACGYQHPGFNFGQPAASH
jgi:hypothetical protein